MNNKGRISMPLMRMLMVEKGIGIGYVKTMRCENAFFSYWAHGF